MLRDEDRVGHIVDAAARIAGYLGSTTWEEFCRNPMIQDAVLRQLMIVGEAASRLSLSYREELPMLPWANIIGFRHRIVHDYLGIDLEVVWLTATLHLPEFVRRLSPNQS
jgi:uncharacterized protein with HEPN domain